MTSLQQASYHRTVLGGKEYPHGNHVWVVDRRIVIEFDSDYSIVRHFDGKNWFKLACRQAEKIPDPVSLAWLARNGYEIPKELRQP